MASRKGKTNNPNGRPKGSFNKVSKEIKEKVANFINDKINDIDGEWNKMDIRDKLKFIVELLPYVLSKNISETPEDKPENDFFKKILNTQYIKTEAIPNQTQLK